MKNVIVPCLAVYLPNCHRLVAGCGPQGGPRVRLGGQQRVGKTKGGAKRNVEGGERKGGTGEREGRGRGRGWARNAREMMIRVGEGNGGREGKGSG